MFDADQAPPPFRLTKTPPPPVPAYTVPGVVESAARAVTFVFVNPLLTALHVVPLSVLL